MEGAEKGMIDEKMLMRRMKENYRAGGYRVGTMMESGRELLAVSGGTWYAVLPLAAAGNDLKALIVLHTGAMPGRAVTVQKDSGVQLMMSGELAKIRTDCLAGACGAKRCGRTPLLLGGYEIWQDGSGRCALYDGALTDIFALSDDETEQTMSESNLYLRDCEGELLVAAVECRGHQGEMLEHLSGYTWAEVNDETDCD